MFAARGARKFGGPVMAGQFHIAALSRNGGETWSGLYTGIHGVDDAVVAEVGALVPDHAVNVNRSAVTNIEFVPPLPHELMVQVAGCIGAAIGMKEVHYFHFPFTDAYARPAYVQPIAALPEQR